VLDIVPTYKLYTSKQWRHPIGTVFPHSAPLPESLLLSSAGSFAAVLGHLVELSSIGQLDLQAISEDTFSEYLDALRHQIGCTQVRLSSGGDSRLITIELI
jgi:hypothetical protein